MANIARVNSVNFDLAPSPIVFFGSDTALQSLMTVLKLHFAFGLAHRAGVNDTASEYERYCS